MQLHVTDSGQDEDAQAVDVEHDDLLHREQCHWYVDNSCADHDGGASRVAHSSNAAASAQPVLDLGWDVELHV